jgi:hypothetical protein
VLRLNFRSVCGDAPTLTVAQYFRFCADGTLRGPENYLVARREDGLWRLSGRMHRELECEGPVHVRLNRAADRDSRLLGPFAQLRTVSGVLYGDNACLHVALPGCEPRGEDECRELTLLPGAPRDAKT